MERKANANASKSNLKDKKMLNLLYYSYSKFTKVKGQYLKFGRIAVN